MDDIGSRWTVWEGNGKPPGLAEKVVAEREDGYPTSTIGPPPVGKVAAHLTASARPPEAEIVDHSTVIR